MHRLGHRLRLVITVSCFALAGPAGAATVPEAAYADLSWRFVGPYRSGWAIAVAGAPDDVATFYFGGADGGVFRTTDAGVTWQSLFDSGGSASVGALAVAPSDPRVLWIGTGQIHMRWDIVDGDGVYRSTDGGETWTHVGLEETRHIGNLHVDPRDANVAIVAALGHVFGPNPERGLFRTEDGGQSWSHVLDRGPEVGAVDIAGDPAQPDVLYASLWQVRRHPWLDYFQPTVGEGSGIVKSTDAGRTWTDVGTPGLPAGPRGRIELAVAPGTGSRRVWALIDAESGAGLYRSEDGGESWALVNDDSSLASDYMSGLEPDPRNPEILWALGRGLRRSADGGRSFAIAKGAPGGDDYHCLWIDPTNPRRMILGADQGAVLTLNGGETWSSWYNQPTGQFYRLATDDQFPYRIYSGQQDSGTVSLASRSDYGQLTFRDWNPVGGDERDGDVPDPLDPNIVYGAGLGGRLSRWDARTGQVKNVSPWPVSSYAARPGTTRYRYDWITPVAVSPLAPHALYLGAQVLFRSSDRGETWDVVSPDLTGAEEGAEGCDGDVPRNRATACGYGVIFAISPSPVAAGVVWVGTTNGRVQLTRDGGATWQDVTPPGMEDWTKVNIIDASPHDPGTAYVAADRHRVDEPGPLVWRTRDFGASWTSIAGGLPDSEWVGVARQDPKQPGLLFAGTNRGVYVSFDDGGSWQSLRLDIPTTGINDLLVHGDDVIVATQGRGIQALDGIEPLRHLAGADLTTPVLLPPAAAIRLRANQNNDTPLPPEEPRAPNPPTGALFDYVLPSAPVGPVVLEISDAAGEVVRTFRSDTSPERPPADVYFAEEWIAPPPVPSARAGHNRFVWDLRLEPPRAIEYEYSIAAVPGGAIPAPSGPLALPGRYQVKLAVDGHASTQPLTIVMDPRVEASEAELRDLLAFQRQVAESMAASAQLAEEEPSPADDPRSGSDPAKINRSLAALARDLESADSPPTAAQREVLAFYRAALDEMPSAR
jgi:photosystem II stability/assembly factor-like uncharacterized protein